MPIADHNPDGFFRLINNPFKFNLFLISKLPAAFFAGLKMQRCDRESCSVSIRYKWLTQNPFRSTYFACLAMAAEMSTGALAMANLYKRKPAVSMLITGMESKYYKKAIGKTVFVCKQGLDIKSAIDKAYETADPQTIKVKTEGYNEQNEIVAEFWFTWSFKVKQ